MSKKTRSNQTSGLICCTSRRNTKTTDRTANFTTRDSYKTQTISREKDNIIKGYKPAFTTKFKKWKTFCVVQPYSGTLHSILTS